MIRGLAMDAPQRAGSGHPGTAMALAPLAHVLFSKVMHHDPSDPDWPDRDRFVLSCGHASILLYSMLYLTGYGLTLEDLKALPPMGKQDARAPRGAPDPRRRGHDRSARSGIRQRRRARPRRKVARERASVPTSSTTTPSSSARTATSKRA